MREDKRFLRLIQTFSRTFRRHLEAEVQKRRHLERDKVLCDLLVHQNFFQQVHLARCQQDDTIRAGSKKQLKCLEVLQHTPLPDSYVARLVRAATPEQVQRALSMSEEDWCAHFSDVFPILLAQLEMSSRSEHSCSTAASLTNPSSNLRSTQTGRMDGPSNKNNNNSSSSTRPDTDAPLFEGCFPAAAATAAPSATAAAAAQASSSVPAWQPGLLTPSTARDHLQHTMDAAVQLTQLAYMLSLKPLLDAAEVNLVAGPGVKPSPQHFEEVVDRLNLTETQELQISICMEELERMSQGACIEGSRLLLCAAQPSLQLAAAQRQQQQQQQQQRQPPLKDRLGGASSSSAAAAVQQQQQLRWVASDAEAPTAASWLDTGLLLPASEELPEPWQEYLAHQLQHHMDKRHLHLLLAHSFVVNTLTRHQLAVLTVASFPYIPRTIVIAHAISARLKQRQQQQLKQAELAARQQARAGVLGASCDQDVVGTTGLLDAADIPGRGGVGGGGGGSWHSNAKASAFAQQLLEEHQHKRGAELLLHQHACWAELDGMLMQC